MLGPGSVYSVCQFGCLDGTPDPMKQLPQEVSFHRDDII